MKGFFKRLRRYCGFELNRQRRYYAMEGFDLYVRTPLFGLRVARHGYNVLTDSLFSGIELSLLPANWRLNPGEGMMMYRHFFKRGVEYRIKHFKGLL